jgi:hypothetical protein
MWNKLLLSPLLYAYLAAGVLVATAFGLILPGKFPLPVLQVAAAYPVMYGLLARGRRGRAIVAMLWWALLLGVTMVTACVWAPDAGARNILNGTEYRQEMFDWIRTGQGAEGSPALFIPQHLLHLAVFLALSLTSASLLSLLMGAVLMNYMSFYVAALILAAGDTPVAILMGWHPWSIIRVAAFVLLGVVLGEPLVCRISGRPYEFAGVRRYMALGAAGVVCDIVMKALLAPWWGLTLRNLIS